MDNNLIEQTFVQSRLKIQRANRHINEARQWFAAYLQGDFHNLVDERDTQTGRQSIKLVVMPIPADLVLAVGDAFHCLSSALEYVMSGLMVAKTGEALRIHFPTNKSRDALRRSFMRPTAGRRESANRKIMKSFPLVALEILTGLKPYEGGKYSLWEIRQADNLDKHNLIIPSTCVTEVRGVSLIDRKYNNIIQNTNLRVGSGNTLNVFGYQQVDSYLEFTDKGKAMASLCFPSDAEIFSNQDIFLTLAKCSQNVWEAVGRLETTARRYI